MEESVSSQQVGPRIPGLAVRVKFMSVTRLLWFSQNEYLMCNWDQPIH